MVSQPATTKDMAVIAGSVQLMVENMVSQPATTKDMAVIARRYANLLDQATLLFKQETYGHPPPSPPLLSLSLSFLAFYFPQQFSILLSPSDQDSHFW